MGKRVGRGQAGNVGTQLICAASLVGTWMANEKFKSQRQVHRQVQIALTSAFEAIGFYEKFGFVSEDNGVLPQLSLPGSGGENVQFRDCIFNNYWIQDGFFHGVHPNIKDASRLRSTGASGEIWKRC